nr:HNH endonuclease [Paenibacillus sp. UNC496MF]
MPAKSKRPCGQQGCRNLSAERFCQEHKSSTDLQRGTAAQRGYDSKWRKVRVFFLMKHPLCTRCIKENRITAATIVDHIRPHKGDKALFWDRNNWQPLCKSCHDTKTVREDGGFGNL